MDWGCILGYWTAYPLLRLKIRFGVTFSHIAGFLGVCRQTVQRWCFFAQVPTRRRAKLAAFFASLRPFLGIRAGRHFLRREAMRGGCSAGAWWLLLPIKGHTRRGWWLDTWQARCFRLAGRSPGTSWPGRWLGDAGRWALADVSGAWVLRWRP